MNWKRLTPLFLIVAMVVAAAGAASFQGSPRDFVPRPAKLLIAL
jgi:hypothetical protein